MGGRRRTRYCETCGHPHGATANFCGNCGEPTPRENRHPRDQSETERPRGAPRRGETGGNRRGPERRRPTEPRQRTRTRPAGREITPEERAALERRAERKLRAGWELEADNGDHVVLTKHGYGSAGMHVLIGLFTFWWTLGIGNALYAASCYYGDPERLVMRAADVDPEPAADESSSLASTVLVVGLLWLLGLGFLSTASVAGAVIGTLLLLAGTALVPPVRRRLGRRHPVTTNGRIQTVDERIVDAPEDVCASCSDHIERGVERTYRDEYYVAGVPTRTYQVGKNVYCQSCAAADPMLGNALEEGRRSDLTASDGDPTRTSRTTADREKRPSSWAETEPHVDRRDGLESTDPLEDRADAAEQSAADAADRSTTDAENRATAPAEDRTEDDLDVDEQLNIGDQPAIGERPDEDDRVEDESTSEAEAASDEDVEHESA